MTGQYLSGARQIPLPANRRRAVHNRWLKLIGATRQQPEERHRGDSARHVRLRHRRVGRREIHADHRDALQGGGAAPEQCARAAGAAREDPRPRIPRQGHRHRSVADRAHAALEPGDVHGRVHADPRMVRRACRRRKRAAMGRGASRSTSRAGAARRARATASSRSRCTSCPTSTCSATCARASAITARRWK